MKFENFVIRNGLNLLKFAIAWTTFMEWQHHHLLTEGEILTIDVLNTIANIIC